MTRINMYSNTDLLKDVFVPRQFGQLIDSLLKDSRPVEQEAVVKPAVDIADFEDRFELQMSLPGLTKEDIKIDLDGQKLTISGERKSPEAENGPKFIVRETWTGKFRRSFNLPKNVDPEKTEARFENGILMLAIPKAEKQSRQIEVK